MKKSSLWGQGWHWLELEDILTLIANLDFDVDDEDESKINLDDIKDKINTYSKKNRTSYLMP